MPSKSKAQQGMIGADLARVKAGKPSKTGMDAAQLTDFAATPTTGLPQKVSVSKAKGEKNQGTKSKNVARKSLPWSSQKKK